MGRVDIYVHDADPLESWIGKWVKFIEPSVAYKSGQPFTVQNKKRGQVKRTLRGQLEVKAATGGYHLFSPSKIEAE